MTQADRAEMAKQGRCDRFFCRQARSGVPSSSVKKPHSAPISRKRRDSAGFGSSFQSILKFGFELKNMLCHIFQPKAKQRPTEKGRRSKRAGSSRVASREGVHRSAIVERGLAKELQVSVNHNDLGYLEKALQHLLTAEKLLSSAGAKSPAS